jgi:hypothetical protein
VVTPVLVMVTLTVVATLEFTKARQTAQEPPLALVELSTSAQEPSPLPVFVGTLKVGVALVLLLQVAEQ